jgi:hypothetical protein
LLRDEENEAVRAQIENEALQATQMQAFAFVLHVVCIECIASICNPWQHKLRMRQLSISKFLNEILLLLSVCSEFSFRVFAGIPNNMLLHLLVKNISLFLDRLPFCLRAILDLDSMILETIEFVAGRRE